MMWSSILTQPIKEIAPHIFDRQATIIPTSASLLDAASLLLPGLTVFVNGIVIAVEQRPLGRVGSKQILKAIWDSKKTKVNVLELGVHSVMVDIGKKRIEPESPLRDALEIFKATKFAFVPVCDENGKVLTSFAVRDILPFIAKSSLEIPSNTVSSKLKTISKDASVRHALKTMFEENIRKVIIEIRDNGNQIFYSVTDRDMIEFFISQKARRAFSTGEISKLLDTRIMSLVTKPIPRIAPENSISEAAKVLIETPAPVSAVGASIITPMDMLKALVKS